MIPLLQPAMKPFPVTNFIVPGMVIFIWLVSKHAMSACCKNGAYSHGLPCSMVLAKVLAAFPSSPSGGLEPEEVMLAANSPACAANFGTFIAHFKPVPQNQFSATGSGGQKWAIGNWSVWYN